MMCIHRIHTVAATHLNTALAPEEEALLAVLGDGESEDDGPDEAQNELAVLVHQVGGPDVRQLQLLQLEVLLSSFQ